ncbi:hypothetical protein WI42_16470 [Burkholderia ubonensis]|nr:hypothetical protein WI42_16470 [Burkholderia ubonensis]
MRRDADDARGSNDTAVAGPFGTRIVGTVRQAAEAGGDALAMHRAGVCGNAARSMPRAGFARCNAAQAGSARRRQQHVDAH